MLVSTGPFTFIIRDNQYNWNKNLLAFIHTSQERHRYSPFYLSFHPQLYNHYLPWIYLDHEFLLFMWVTIHISRIRSAIALHIPVCPLPLLLPKCLSPLNVLLECKVFQISTSSMNTPLNILLYWEIGLPLKIPLYLEATQVMAHFRLFSCNLHTFGLGMRNINDIRSPFPLFVLSPCAFL